MKSMNKCCGSCCYPCSNSKNVQIDAAGQNWYSQENIDRVWKDGKDTGLFLMCHQTDPNASDYGGKDSKKDYKHTHACVGYAFFVYMHIKIYTSVDGNMTKYKALVGHNVAMSKRGLLEAVISFGMGRSGLFGGMYLPTEMNDDPDQLRYPTGFEKTRAVFAALPVEQEQAE